MHPFFELTNRTPSPSQKEDYNYRKHSPWTAARHKKKTRSVQQQSGDPVYQQAIPEAFDSPAAQVKTVGGSAEYSLAECLSPASKGTSSPHSSPPVSKGSADDAEVHPSKAYIPDPQAVSSPQGMELGSAGGVDLAAGVAANNCRSPVWFRNSTVADDVQEAGARPQLHASSSAPACGNLFDRFDQAAHPAQKQQHQEQAQLTKQQPLQHHHLQPCMQMHAPAGQLLQKQQQHAGQPGVAAVRGRRLTARRGSWSGSDQQQRARSSTASSIGCSRLASAAAGSSSMCHAGQTQDSSSSDWLRQQPVARPDQQSAAALMFSAAGMHSNDSGFQLHSRLSHIDDDLDEFEHIEQRRDFGSGFLQQLRGERVGPARGSEGQLGLAAAWAGDMECTEEGTLAWFEAQVQGAAEAGDIAEAQQLWSSLQAVGLKPSHTFMNGFLICCHYAGADPVEAEEAVRDMCATADIEPNSMTTKLLTLVDISWQQLQGGL